MGGKYAGKGIAFKGENQGPQLAACCKLWVKKIKILETNATSPIQQAQKLQTKYTPTEADGQSKSLKTRYVPRCPSEGSE